MEEKGGSVSGNRRGEGGVGTAGKDNRGGEGPLGVSPVR